MSQIRRVSDKVNIIPVQKIKPMFFIENIGPAPRAEARG